MVYRLLHFNDASIDKRWVDFEKEISRVIQRIDGAISNPRLLINKNTGDFDNKIEEWAFGILATIHDEESKQTIIDIIKRDLLLDLNKLIRALELYLIYYIENKQIEIATKLDIVESLEIDNIISFNYTHTYEYLYGKDKNSYDYIQERANKNGLNLDTCNMVLGIDEYLDSPDRNTNNIFIDFKKFYQRIFKKTGCKYREWIESINNFNLIYTKAKKQEINIFFYGHSLDITDKDIIEALIKNPSTRTTIFYHNREALGKLIANLVAILGEEYVITNTG